VTAERCPLIMLPGSLCDARLFGPQLAALRHRSVAVGNVGAADSVQAIAAQVLRRAPGRFALAGLSMGGIVAFEVWRQAPQRVAGLALLDSTFQPESAEVAARRLEEIDLVAREGTLGLRRLVRDRHLARYLAQGNVHRQALRDLVLQMATACGPAVFARQWQALMHRPDSRATLRTIDCPALVLCGAEDQLCLPAVHQEMARALGVDCHLLDHCGHLASVEAPQRTCGLLRGWLEQVDARESHSGRDRRDVAC
jgi:pimeloyl-ACP methyl ester carboxylesterase